MYIWVNVAMNVPSYICLNLHAFTIYIYIYRCVLVSRWLLLFVLTTRTLALTESPHHFVAIVLILTTHEHKCICIVSQTNKYNVRGNSKNVQTTDGGGSVVYLLMPLLGATVESQWRLKKYLYNVHTLTHILNGTPLNCLIF